MSSEDHVGHEVARTNGRGRKLWAGEGGVHEKNVETSLILLLFLLLFLWGGRRRVLSVLLLVDLRKML